MKISFIYLEVEPCCVFDSFNYSSWAACPSHQISGRDEKPTEEKPDEWELELSSLNSELDTLKSVLMI